MSETNIVELKPEVFSPEIKKKARSILNDAFDFETIFGDEERIRAEVDGIDPTVGNVLVLACRQIGRHIIGEELFNTDLSELDEDVAEAKLKEASGMIASYFGGVAETMMAVINDEDETHDE